MATFNIANIENIAMEDLSKKTKYEVLPWIEKYRPYGFDEIISHETVITILMKTIDENRLQHLLFHGSSGTGKCLARGTQVIMYDGSIMSVENIKKGDLLMGDNNTQRTVLSTTTGEDVMYRIIQSEGDNYEVNSEHIISLKLSCGIQEKWLEKEKLYKLIWFENHLLKEKIFNNFKSKELLEYKKYLIDNNIANKKGDICDISIRQYIKKQVEWKNMYKGFKCERITCWKNKTVDIDPYILGYWLGDNNNNNNNNDKSFSDAIKKYNLFNNKHIPIDYKINDVEIRLQMLAGFLDADGYFLKSNIFEICQKSKNLFNDIKFMARSLGLMVSIRESKFINDIEYYRANIYGDGIENIPIKIVKRVADEYKHLKNPSIYEIKIEELPRDKYYGFEIDGNKRFLLGDFTVTHNTSTVMACARKLYGDKMDLMMLNINASEERGIEVVRNRIQQFVNAKIIHSENNKSVFKLVILDEADAMTADAQAMLRKVIEKYSYCTRFCLICNYIKKISPALQSRCVCYRFPPLKAEDIKGKVLKIAAIENVNITNRGIDTIIKRSKGDMRKVLNILQATSMSYDQITEFAVNKCIGYPTGTDIKKIFNSLMNDIFEDSYTLIRDIKTKNSYSLQDIVTEVSDELIRNIKSVKGMIEILKITTIMVSLGEIEYNLTTCTNESLQLAALVGIFKRKVEFL